MLADKVMWRNKLGIEKGSMHWDVWTDLSHMQHTGKFRLLYNVCTAVMTILILVCTQEKLGSERWMAWRLPPLPHHSPAMTRFSKLKTYCSHSSSENRLIFMLEKSTCKLSDMWGCLIWLCGFVANRAGPSLAALWLKNAILVLSLLVFLMWQDT